MALRILVAAGVFSFTRYMMRAGPNEPNTVSSAAKATIQARASTVPITSTKRPYVDVVARHDEWSLDQWMPFLWGSSDIIFAGDVLPLRCRAAWDVLGDITLLFWGEEYAHRRDGEWLEGATNAVRLMVNCFDDVELTAWHLKVPLAALLFELHCVGGLCSAESTAVPGTHHSDCGKKYNLERSIQWLVDEMCNGERQRNKAKQAVAKIRQHPASDVCAWYQWLEAIVQFGSEAMSRPTHLDVMVWGQAPPVRVCLCHVGVKLI
jgi:hypothetical protein